MLHALAKPKARRVDFIDINAIFLRIAVFEAL